MDSEEPKKPTQSDMNSTLDAFDTSSMGNGVARIDKLEDIHPESRELDIGEDKRLAEISPLATEEVQDYRPGGYHPTHIGDILNDRFEVVHRIDDNGGFGIVWLCLDLQRSNGDSWQWTAVKILMVEESSFERSDLKVTTVLRESGLTFEDWEASHLALPREHFWIEGPNGRHMAEVLALRGPEISDLDVRADVHIVKKLTFQIAKGLHFLHSRTGFVHGEVQPRNVLHRLKDTSGISKSRMLELLGKPSTEAVRYTSGEHPGPAFPQYIVTSTSLAPLGVADDEIAIIDFRQAFKPGDTNINVLLPVEYSSPEWEFDAHPLGFGVDIWSLACIIVNLRLGRTLFGWKIFNAIANLEAMLGPFPAVCRPGVVERLKEVREDIPGWLEEWNEDLSEAGLSKPLCEQRELEGRKARLQSFSARTGFGDPICAMLALDQQYYSLEGGRWRQKIHKIPDDEVLILGDLLGRIFKYDPDERLDTRSILAHSWFGEPEEPGEVAESSKSSVFVDAPESARDKSNETEGKPDRSPSCSRLAVPLCTKRLSQFGSPSPLVTGFVVGAVFWAGTIVRVVS